MCNPNIGTAADKQEEECAAVRAHGRNWKPSSEHAGMHMHAQTHTHSKYMSDINESFHSLP